MRERADELAARRKYRQHNWLPTERLYTRAEVEAVLYSSELIPRDSIAAILEDIDWDAPTPA